MSEHKIINEHSNTLIVCFGGMQKKMGMILPFEFLNYLSKLYGKITDLYFFIDKNQCWYHKGLRGITENIDETVTYINNIISRKHYKRVLFMGVSAGGYASILFGSLCNVNNVLAFIPRTKLIHAVDEKYIDAMPFIRSDTQYTIHGDINITNKNDNHHISQCQRLNHFDNIHIISHEGLNMKELRDNGLLKQYMDKIII